jgi:hypothetical protein
MGNELKTIIEKAILPRDEHFWSVVRQLKNELDDFRACETGARELAATLPTPPSIDEALHWWRDRKEIVEFGKLAIAYFILRAERRSLLLFREDGRVDVDRVAATWYAQFMSIALSGLDLGRVTCAFQNVTIINFNYDRTIEHYLYHALHQRACVTKQAAKDAIARLAVIRPYGRIGPLEWQQDGGIPFGGSDDALYEAVTAMKNIRTFTEQTEGSPVLGEIAKALEEAQLMIILGFGFHQQNMELFNAGYNDRTRGNVVLLLATVLDLDERNYDAIGERLKHGAKIGAEPLFVNMRSGDAMSKLRPKISMGAA